MPLDSIYLNDITAKCSLGVYEEEHAAKQAIKIDLEMQLDYSEACITDDVVDTVDYAQVSKLVQEVALKKKYKLLEHLNSQILDALFSSFKKLEGIRIKTYKPVIIEEGFSGNVFVELYRTRE